MVGANPSALREDVSNNKKGRWAIVAFRLAGRGFGQSVLGAWGTVGKGPVRFPVSTSILVRIVRYRALVLAAMLPKVQCDCRVIMMMYCGDPVAAWSVASSDSDSGQGPPCEETGQLGPGCTTATTTRRERNKSAFLVWPK